MVPSFVDLAPSLFGPGLTNVSRKTADEGKISERTLGTRPRQNEPRGVGFTTRRTMDFKGQKLAERMYQVILVIAGIIAFLAGYLSGSFDTMSYVFTCGVIVAVILCVPDWNYFNQHPIKWLPIDEDHPDWETKYKPQMEAKGGAKGRKQESKKKR